MKAPSPFAFLILGLVLSYFWPDAFKVMIAAWVLWNVGLFFRNLMDQLFQPPSLKSAKPSLPALPVEAAWVCEVCNLEMDKVTVPAGYPEAGQQVWRCPNFKSCHQWQLVEEMQN